MSNEEGEVTCVEYYFVDENPSDVELLDQRELIQLVKNNPPLFAKTTKEYSFFIFFFFFLIRIPKIFLIK